MGDESGGAVGMASSGGGGDDGSGVGIGCVGCCGVCCCIDIGERVG